MASRRFGLVLLLPVFCLVGTTHAQTASADSALQLARAGSWYVRAGSVGSVLAEGVMREIRADSAVIGVRRVDIAAITQLERRLRVGGGAKAGAIAGAASLGAIGYFIATGFCEGDCSRQESGAFLIGASVGGLLGAFVGELLHPADHVWHLVWRKADR